MPSLQAKSPAMSCTECRQLLSRYPEPILVSDKAQESLRRHYNDCMYCQEWGAVDRANKPKQEKP